MPQSQMKKMNFKQNKIVLLVFFLTIHVSMAQQESGVDTMATQSLTIVKSYSPSLKAVIKVKSNPFIPTENNTAKKKVDYAIKNIAFESTYKPNKATPLRLQRQKRKLKYNTLISSGLGNRGQLHFDLSSYAAISKTQAIGVFLARDGYFTNVQNSQFQSSKWSDYVGLNHDYKTINYRVDTRMSLHQDRNNFFGIFPIRDNDNVIFSNKRPLIKRSTFQFATDWNWYKTEFKDLNVQLNVTTDNFNSLEQQVKVSTRFDVLETIAVNLYAHGVKSNFKSDSISNLSKDSEYAKLGTFIKHNIRFDDLNLAFGAQFIYFISKYDPFSSPYVFPYLLLTYGKSKLNPYLKMDGDLRVNSYKSISDHNPYMAPMLTLLPTRNKHHTRLGVKSKSNATVNLDLNAGYQSLDNYPQISRYPANLRLSVPYRFSNAFDVNYIPLNQFDFNIHTRIDLGNENNLQFNAQYFKYWSTSDTTLLNLPEFTFEFKAQFKLANRLFFDTKTTFIGERNAQKWSIATPNQMEHIQLPPFIASDFYLSYHLSKKWDTFIKGRVTNSETHARWGYFPENPLLVLLGFRMKLNLNL